MDLYDHVFKFAIVIKDFAQFVHDLFRLTLEQVTTFHYKISNRRLKHDS